VGLRWLTTRPTGLTGKHLKSTPALPKRPGFTVRLSEPPACSVFDPQRKASDSGFAARRHRFSACAGSVQRTLPHEHLSTGAGNPGRPFARSQRRFRHHCEVDAPDLPSYFPARRRHRFVRFRTPCPSRRTSPAASSDIPVTRPGIHSP